MQQKDMEIVYPTSQAEWRQWLRENHHVKQSVWLGCYKKQTNKPTISWSEAVDEALCFGWIDSIRKSLDDGAFIQLFSKRKLAGTWSKINKEKVERLIEDGRMTAAGLASIERAKQNGSWTILDDVEELIIPPDLAKAFKRNKASKAFFLSLSKSVRKAILQWIVLAKQPQTRQKRISEVAELAAQKQKPKHLS